MIKINKNLLRVPESLVPAFKDLFPEAKYIPIITRNTHAKRMEIIGFKQYKDEDKYNALYKREDIKKALNDIYKSKCAFCEIRIEQWNVEHYRPKKIYYWLAFSWDNLILACPTCNGHKDVNFKIAGKEITFENSEVNIRQINVSSAGYDSIEEPLMVNPESTDPLGFIEFSRNGVIVSSNPRFAYTIDKCKIDRKWLNDERKHILEVYERDIRSALIENQNLDEQEKEIKAITRKFIRDTKDALLQFLAFRRFAVSSGWLNEIIKEMN